MTAAAAEHRIDPGPGDGRDGYREPHGGDRSERRFGSRIADGAATAVRRAHGSMLGVILSMFVCGPGLCDEGGVAFWFSGQDASLAAVPATPGILIRDGVLLLRR